MNKKKVSVVFLLLFLHLSTKAVDVKVDHILYSADSDSQTAVVIGTEPDYKGSVTIPEEFTAWSKPYRVTAIADNAFRGHSGITSVSIAESVATIGKGAFSGCKNMTSVKLPSQLKVIEDEVFNGSGLLTIEIPQSVTAIGYSAFGGSSLTSISISDKIEVIGNQAFGWCKGLESITIPGNGNTSIGEEAFYYCEKLQTAVFGDGVASIGAKVFDYCVNL